MHESVMNFGRRMIERGMVRGKAVVEVGSQNINGSLRSVVEALNPGSYLGFDQVTGDGVDLLIEPGREASVLPAAAFDLVICTEVLEHAREWRDVVRLLKHLAKPEGYLLVTTRSPGFPYHPFPEDHWRFTRTDLQFAFADCERVALEDDPQLGHPGVLSLWRKPVLAIEEVDLDQVKPEPAPPSP